MIKRLFTGIADRYDRMNRVLSLGLDRRWRRIAAESVRGTPSRILDLACGTGDLAFALARRFPHAKIVGADLTPAMLGLARRKNASPDISFVEADAGRLPFSADGSFSLVSCAFGFRNFPDRSAALREARRVLSTDGELLVLEFFRPASRLLGRLTALWIRLIAALFARPSQAAYGYLGQSLRTTVSADEFIALATESGFRLADRRLLLPCCTCLRFTI